MASLDSFDVVGHSKYWGGPDIRLGQWFSAAGHTDKTVLHWPQMEHRTVIETFRGRTAIALACKILGLGVGDEILVPAYNCGTEIDALVAAGLNVVAYRVGSDTAIDLDDLMARLSKRTRAVYVIHYFGWEQPMSALRQWCNEHGLKLIEDCALSLFSSGQSGGLGRAGDAAIYSLPKTLGTWHGGILSLARSPKEGFPLLRSAGTGLLFKELKQSLRGEVLRTLTDIGARGLLYALRGSPRYELALDKATDVFNDMPQAYYFNPALEVDRGAHPAVLAIAAFLPWQAIVSERRANYAYLAKRLASTSGVKLLFPYLPDHVCPLSLPLLVKDRDECVAKLLNEGIASFPWWSGFHRGVIDWEQFPDACQLKRSVLTVPVYQGLPQIDNLARVVDHVLRS
jgi:dTDP-4-amino-4,6-dideoxygalactose transaminase